MKRFNKLISKILIVMLLTTSVIVAQPVSVSIAMNNKVEKKISNENKKEIEVPEENKSEDMVVSQSAITKNKPENKISHGNRGKVEILIKYKSENKAKNVKQLTKGNLKLSKFESKKDFKKNKLNKLKKLDLVEVDKDADMNLVINELKNNPDVEYVQPNYKLEINSMPTDLRFSDQWGLLNTGQEVEGIMGRSGVDINAVNAWDITKGSDTVVIGVLDTGIDINHTDLADNIYTNTGEIPDDGIDNDNNGYIDDVHGWNFAIGNNSVYDSEEDDTHGTQIAGIIAAIDNTTGITGVAPDVKVLPLKFIHGGSGYTSDAIEAINYAMEMGVQVINCSFSGYDDNPALKDAMENSGILFVTAAGNRGGDIEQYPVYPAGFDLPNILSVASVDSTGVLMPYSTFGEMVDVAAPGENILSTAPADSYAYINGTSASAALASGIVALSKSHLPTLTNIEIADRIKNNVVVCATLQNKLETDGRVDAYAALTNTPPPLDSYVDPDGDDPVIPLEPEDLDSWFTADQISKIKETLHYGESGVNPGTGNFSVTVNDMQIPAPGFNININRTYNSKNDIESILGRGWTFGFEGYIEGTEVITVMLPDASIQMFKKNEDAYIPLDSRSTLIKNSDDTYQLTTKDQYRYGYNSEGYLTWMKDRNGNTVNIIFDSNDRIDYITDTVGRQYDLHYNADDQIEYITGPENMRIDYTYNSNDCLETVTDSEGNVMRYTYDSYNYLNEIKNHNNEIIENIVYSHSSGASQHKVEQATDAYGCTNTYTYGNGYTTILEGGERYWVYWFDNEFYITEIHDPEGRSTITEYYLEEDGKNKYGDIKSIRDRNGNKTSYEIDDRGNVTKITNPDLSFSQYEYDEKNNLIKETDESGYQTFYIYDANKINLIKEVHPLNKEDAYTEGTSDPNYFAITQYTYYTLQEAENLFNCSVTGLLKSEVNPLGNVTQYTYDAEGNIVHVTDPLNHITQYGYDGAGRKVYTITPKGYRTDYDYNQNGQLTKKTLHGGETTRIIYDETGRQIQVVEPKQYNPSLDTNGTYTGTDQGYRYTYYIHGGIETVTDPENNMTSYTYDVYGNKVTETLPNNAVYSYEYDNLNRLTKTYFSENASASAILLKEYSYDVISGGKSQETETVYLNDAETAVTISIYDYKDRLVEKQNPDGTLIRKAYNANGSIKTVTHENGSTTYYKYDDMNRLKEQWEPLEASSDTTLYAYTKYIYDNAGKKVEEKHGKTKVALDAIPTSYITKTFGYDAKGNVTSITDNEARKTEYHYDDDGNLDKEEIYTNATKKIITEYEYNYLNKPDEKKQYIKAGNLFGNSFESTQTTLLTTSYTYDDNGNIETITTPDNVITSYTYDNLNRKLSESMPGVDENGNSVTITTSVTYDWEGNPLTKTDAENNITTYHYNQKGLLESIIDAKEGVTIYAYDRAGRKIIEISPENYDSEKTLEEMDRTEYVYDKMNRIKLKILKYHKQTVNPSTQEWTSTWVEYVTKAFKYDSSGNMIKELEALGYQEGLGTTIDNKINSGYGTLYTYNLANQLVAYLDPASEQKCLPYTMKYEYDALGRKVKEIKGNGVITKYEYDDGGNITSTKIKKTQSSQEKTISTCTYDLAGRKLTETDGNGNTVSYEYNAFNKLRKVIYPEDTTIASNTVIFQYDVNGNLKKQMDSMDHVDLYEYDNQGNVLSYTSGRDGGTENINITMTTAYDKNGNKRFETDGEGTTTEYVYDELNRIVESKKSVDGLLKTTSFDYDKNGNLIATTDWRGNVSTNIYDPIDRLIEKQNPYTTIQKLEYNNNNVQVKSWDAQSNMTQYQYDRNNRLLITIDPEGHQTSQTYDAVGNIKTKTDGENNTTQYTYDEFNNLKSVINEKNETTSYTYDLNGNMMTQIDGKGNVTAYEYNVMNLMVKRIDDGGRTGSSDDYEYIDSKIESYTYYVDGNMATKVDRNGKTTHYTYDIHGRMATKTIGDETISYTYDNNGNQLTITDSVGTTIRTYDEENRVLTKEVPYIGTMTYEYDIISGGSEGYTSERYTDPKGSITNKTFDKAGRLKEVTTNGQTTTYNYYANGSRQNVIYPNGAREDYTYYADGLLHTLTNKDGSGSTIDTYSYTYDGAHNQTSKTDAKGTTAYLYDELNRLRRITEPGGKVTIYTYDKAGNRLTESVTEEGSSTATVYAYNEQNRLMSTTAQEGVITQKITYTYDANGNTLTTTKQTFKPIEPDTDEDIYIYKVGESTHTDVTFFEYDVWNQLTKTKEADKIATYQYNGEGYRVEKTVNGETTRYLYEYDKVMLEIDETGNETARNVYGLNLLSREADGTELFYMYNGHADVTALLDENDNIISTYYYDAFGVILESTGTADNPIRYAGYQFDEETELYYLNARYYDPVTARFLTEDTYRGTANDPLSLNLYTYCFNNPVTYWDPTGHVVTGWDRDNLSDRQIATVCRATSLYNISNATGDKSGKRLAHQIAESTRNEVRRGTNQIGSASGYTYTVDDRGNATLYRGDSDLINRNRINGTTTLNGSNYIPVTKANAIDIVKENILSLVPNAKVPSPTMGANNAQIILSAENQTSESLSIMTDSMYAEGINSDVYFTLEEYLGDTDIANAYMLRVFDFDSNKQITEYIVPYKEGCKFDIKFETFSDWSRKVLIDTQAENICDTVAETSIGAGLALSTMSTILSQGKVNINIPSEYIIVAASTLSWILAPDNPTQAGDYRIEVSVITNQPVNNWRLSDYTVENYIRYNAETERYDTYDQNDKGWSDSIFSREFYPLNYSQIDLFNIR